MEQPSKLGKPVAVAGACTPSRDVTSTCIAVSAMPCDAPDLGLFSELTPSTIARSPRAAGRAPRRRSLTGRRRWRAWPERRDDESETNSHFGTRILLKLANFRLARPSQNSLIMVRKRSHSAPLGPDTRWRLATQPSHADPPRTHPEARESACGPPRRALRRYSAAGQPRREAMSRLDDAAAEAAARIHGLGNTKFCR